MKRNILILIATKVLAGDDQETHDPAGTCRVIKT